MKPTTPFLFRPLDSADQSFLWECLYLSIHVPAGTSPPTLDILKNPDLSKYAANWGQTGDFGFSVFDPESSKNLGALWLRQFNSRDAGYGFVDEKIPELGMAVIPNHRNQGLGTGLLKNLFKQEKYTAISLSVSPLNPALHLYERFGFKKVGEKGDSWTLLWKRS